MWYIGSFALVLLMAAITWLLGQALLVALGFKPAFARTESGALAVLLGAAILTLTSGWLSWVGMPMRGWGVVLTVILVICAFGTLFLSFRPPPHAPTFRLRGRGIALAAITLFVSYLALLPLLRDNAINPYNDTIASISLGEYLQDHSFRTPVVARVQSPVASMTWLYQRAGLRMGTHFLLALVQSWVPSARSIDVFPTLCCFGVILVLLAAYLSCRWLAKVPAWYGLCACLFAFTNMNLALYSSNSGIMNQLYGIAFAFTGFAVTARLMDAAKGAILRWVVPLGLLSAGLTSVYSEIAPMYGLILLGGAGLRAFTSKRWHWRRMAHLLAAGGVAAILSNVELLRAFRNVLLQMRNAAESHVGYNIDYSALKFLSSWLGVYPGHSDSPVYHTIVRGGQNRALTALAALSLLLWAYGAGTLVWKRKLFRLPEITAGYFVFGALVVYFAWLVKNPFIPGRMGQTWSISKLTMYSFPLGVCILAYALRRLPLARPLALLFALASTIAYLPVHDRLSHIRTETVRGMTRSHDNPFGAYAQFAEQIRAAAQGRPVRLVIPPNDPCLLYELAAYYLYPAPVASDEWHSPGCYYMGGYEGAAFINPPGPYGVTLVRNLDFTAEGSLPAGFVIQREPVPDCPPTTGWQAPGG